MVNHLVYPRLGRSEGRHLTSLAKEALWKSLAKAGGDQAAAAKGGVSIDKKTSAIWNGRLRAVPFFFRRVRRTSNEMFLKSKNLSASSSTGLLPRAFIFLRFKLDDGLCEKIGTARSLTEWGSRQRPKIALFHCFCCSISRTKTSCQLCYSALFRVRVRRAHRATTLFATPLSKKQQLNFGGSKVCFGDQK